MILNAAISAMNTVVLGGLSLPDFLVCVAIAICLVYSISLLCRLIRIIRESRKDD